MNATLISLIAVTVGFAALVAWVYWPSRRSHLETLGRIPLDDSAAAETDPQRAQPQATEPNGADPTDLDPNKLKGATK